MAGIEYAIIRGDYDVSLDSISEAIRLRKSALAPKIWDFAVGDAVRYTNATRPKYLAGTKGKIVEIRRTKVTVELDSPVGRFGKRIVTPLSLIEKV